MIDFPLLKKISETPGAPGFETQIRDLIKSEISGLVDEMYIDTMGSLIGAVSYTHLSVGKVKAVLTKYKGLRYPLVCGD